MSDQPQVKLTLIGTQEQMERFHEILLNYREHPALDRLAMKMTAAGIPDEGLNLDTLQLWDMDYVDGIGMKPAWEDTRFTDSDKDAIISNLMDEVADRSTKELAHEEVEKLSLVEAIGYVFVDDVEELCRMLSHMDERQDPQDYVNGEFLRAHNDDGEDYDSMLDFAKRMRLINEEETMLTELGREFISQNS